MLSKLTLVALATVIVIGAAPAPIDFDPRLSFSHFFMISTPYLLFAAILVRVTTRYRFHRIVACLLLIPAIALTPAALFGPHAMSVFHGGVIQACAVTAILVLVDSPRWALRTLYYVSFAVAVVGSVWSLIALWAVVNHATTLADNRPYCLSKHTHIETPINAYAELRGLRFYTESFNLKAGTKWYFHGPLIIGGSRIERFNWSPRNFRFDPVTFEKLHIPIIGTCEPRENFLQTLPVFGPPGFFKLGLGRDGQFGAR